MNLQRIFSNHVLLNSAVFCVMSGVCLTNAYAEAVYKHIDETGRVSYSNQPRKGAVAVDLAPLTIMQSAPLPKAAAVEKPKVSLPNANAPANPVSSPPVERALPANAALASVAAQPVARISSVPNSELSVASTSPPQTLVKSSSAVVANTSGFSAAAMAKQRREDVKRRIVEGEIEAEDQLLAEARDALASEQARSPAMRMLRTSLPNEAKPSETTIESRALIERHFSRVRDLQDHVMMHEQNLVELKAMLTNNASSASVRPLTSPVSLAKSSAKNAISPKTAPKLEAVISPAKVVKVATVSTTPPSKNEAKNPNVASIATSSAPNPKAMLSASPPSADDIDALATSQLPVVKLRPASNLAPNNVVASLPTQPKRSMAEDR